jgi:hypothetical protein
MPSRYNKRKVKLALIAFTPAKGVGTAFGLRGEEVEVHDDDLERFDDLNNQYDEGAESSVPDQVEEELDAQGPNPTDKGEGLLSRPGRHGRLGEWQAYAEQEGVDTEDEDGNVKTKAQLIAELSA